jgi:hypothetical protein
MKRRTLSRCWSNGALPLDPGGDRYDMTSTGLRDDTTLGAIRLDWWAASDWNGARNTFGIPGRLRRNPHRPLVAVPSAQH